MKIQDLAPAACNKHLQPVTSFIKTLAYYIIEVTAKLRMYKLRTLLLLTLAATIFSFSFVYLKLSNTVLIQNIIKKDFPKSELGSTYLSFKGRFDQEDEIYFKDAYAAYKKSLNIEDPAYYSLFINTGNDEIDKYRDTIKHGLKMWSDERFLMEIDHNGEIYYLVERYIEEMNFHAIFPLKANNHDGIWKLDLTKDDLNQYMFDLVSFYRRNNSEVYTPTLLDKVYITLSPNTTIYDYNEYLRMMDRKDSQ